VRHISAQDVRVTFMADAAFGSRKVQSLDRALDVLQCLADGPKRISEIARETASSKAAVHHILATLEGRRMVTRERDSFRYRLSWGLYELGSAVLRHTGLDTVVDPHLSDLAETIGETTLFAIEEDNSALVLLRGESTTSFLVANNAPGRRIPLHATASGKVLLAHHPTLMNHLTEPLRAFTTNTITERHKLSAGLSSVRRRGFATCWEEHELALSSIGVPVFGRDNVIVGALTVAAPSGRLNRRTYRKYLDPLLQTRDAIHTELGAPPSAVNI
jgi:DNA-binding IclR family transcriptional regulator